jgi:enoyl-[acyl-carrier-protein] reductase (NADH)
MNASEQITKLVTAINDNPAKTAQMIAQLLAASNLELATSLLRIEAKLNNLELIISKMEPKVAKSKKTEVAAAPSAPVSGADGGNVPQAQVSGKPTANNILAYFKQLYEHDEEFRATFHCVDYAAQVEKTEDYLKKTTAEAKRKCMSAAMYNYITKGTNDTCKQKHAALKARHDAYKKSLAAVPESQTLTTDPPSPTN